MPLDKQLARNIQLKMEESEHGDNVAELARQANIRAATVWNIIHKENSRVQLRTLKKIAKALKCTVSELLEGVR